MTIEAKIIADSINAEGQRLTTVQCKYPRFIHSQVMTHRMFSRNAQSSRACPVKKMIKEVEENPAMPIYWGRNQRGMQAGEEVGSIAEGKELWKEACEEAVYYAKELAGLNFHKQIVNRVLEPFMHINVIITATEWSNFFKLRLHDDAQPEIQELARVIKREMDHQKPSELDWGDWHIPYSDSTGKNIKRSVAACARVSYNNHDGSIRDPDKDEALHDILLSDGHMSPFEHQAKAEKGTWNNFTGFKSYRWEIEND